PSTTRPSPNCARASTPPGWPWTSVPGSATRRSTTGWWWRSNRPRRADPASSPHRRGARSRAKAVRDQGRSHRAAATRGGGSALAREGRSRPRSLPQGCRNPRWWERARARKPFATKVAPTGSPRSEVGARSRAKAVRDQGRSHTAAATRGGGSALAREGRSRSRSLPRGCSGALCLCRQYCAIAQRVEPLQQRGDHLDAAPVRRALVQQHDRAGREIALDRRDHLVHVALHGVKAARAPGYARKAGAPQRRMHERIAVADHRTEPAWRAAGDGGELALRVLDLAAHPPRSQRPEPGLRMRAAVVADAVAAAHDLADQFRPGRGAVADQEEGGLRGV